MAKREIIITGDWDEGRDRVLALLKDSHHENVVFDLFDLRQAFKKKNRDLCVFCMQGASDELDAHIHEIRRVNDAFPLCIFSKATDAAFIVSSLKKGVNDFFVRPLDRDSFLKKIEREIHLYHLTQKIFRGDAATGEGCQFENMIGVSRPMRDCFQMIAAVAKSQATVLITGESGTGKELVAKAVHRRSERAAHRFVDINCGAIPKELLENELFGHEKGSFTGAHKRYLGSFETANHGTLFLDEISEMEPLLQVKLLRVLQERAVVRIGSNDLVKVDVRIIAATNKNLTDLIQAGKFREDLFYRLNVVNVDLPPLRDRRNDIPLLAKHFLDYYTARNNRIFTDFSTEAMEALINYDWPGNVRELENTIERIVVLNDSHQVKLSHLPPVLQKVERAIGYFDEPDLGPVPARVVPLEELEKQAIEAALMQFQGNITVAARRLKIGQATLYRKVKKFGLQGLS